MPPDRINDRTLFDAVIIGGGVIGCAIARRLTLDGWRVILWKKLMTFWTARQKATAPSCIPVSMRPPGRSKRAAWPPDMLNIWRFTKNSDCL